MWAMEGWVIFFFKKSFSELLLLLTHNCSISNLFSAVCFELVLRSDFLTLQSIYLDSEMIIIALYGS